eukprot:TRINITY_DN1478_c1_g1_i1.p1 TRINITY_DN1478_c1_g1~~TRINITY_DN1478_c1_g1_i1.p1  ORF type:complete len:785 (+),score=119.97 TRINITY_DN1478_c1_g1_i1:89-2443(+)
MTPAPALLAGLGLLFGPVQGDPLFWRLVLDDTTTKQWHLCNLKFFIDDACSRAPAARMEARISSAAAVQSAGLPLDVVWTEWASKCAGETCLAQEAWLGVRFSDPVVVQCVLYEECDNSASAPAPSPTPPTEAPPSPPSATTTGPSTTNPFSALFEEGLGGDNGGRGLDGDGGSGGSRRRPGGGGGGGGGGGRRLSTAQIDKMVLERSADGLSWTAVAQWDYPVPGAHISLLEAKLRPSHAIPVAVSWSPSNDGCVACGAAGNGIKVQETLQLSFSEKIYFGDGEIQIKRGGGLGTQTLLAVSNPDWFQVNDKKLVITPQVALGTSSSCVEIEIGAGAVMDADGFDYAGSRYATCILDLEPPELTSSDPPNQAPGVELMPKLQLAFNEGVRIRDDAPSAKLAARTSPVGGGLMPASQIIDLVDGLTVDVVIWNPSSGAMAIELYPNSQLEPQCGYELTVLAGTIEDLSGNVWPGGSIFFTTRCSSYGCYSDTTARPTQNLGETDAEGQPTSIAVYLGVVAALTIACAFGIGAFQLYVRRRLFGSSNKVAPTDENEQIIYNAHRMTESGTTPTAKVHVVAGGSATGGGPVLHRATTAKVPEAQWFQGPKTQGPQGRGTMPPQHFHKSREAEDVTRERPSTDAGFQRPHSKTDDDVGRTKSSNAMPRPGKDRQQAPGSSPKSPNSNSSKERQGAPKGSSAGGSSGSASSPKKKEPKELSDNPEVAAHLKALNDELEKTRKEDISSRKKTFKFACLKWHPDKNADNLEVATEVFQWLQTQRDWYLKE